jgi:CDP-diacylglycerol pyrophosphatase
MMAVLGRRFAWSAAALLLGLGAACARSGEAPELALWRIVADGCREGATADPAAPLQCRPAEGIAVLKDRCGEGHYLVLPLARRSGIESAELLQPAEPDYLALAWAQRGRSLGLAPGQAVDAQADLGLAINSRYGRSQAQLHVHIDRVRPAVRAALDALARPVASGTLVELEGHSYRIDRLASLAPSPLPELIRAWQAADEDARAHLTLAVVGDRAGGWFLLSDRADLLRLDRGHAEDLLRERSCR